jgi:DNA-binding MarR family transcriptional regulator
MAGQALINSDRAGAAAVAFATVADRPLLKLEQFLPYRLFLAATLASQGLSQVYARRYHFGTPEWRVLVTLGQHGTLNGKTIGAHTYLHKTKVSRAVALLEKRNLIVRCINSADLRESFVSLTETGRKIYEELAPQALDFARRLTEILTPEDQAAFERVLERLTDRAAQLTAEAVGEDLPVEDE